MKHNLNHWQISAIAEIIGCEPNFVAVKTIKSEGKPKAQSDDKYVQLANLIASTPELQGLSANDLHFAVTKMGHSVGRNTIYKALKLWRNKS